MNPHTVICEYCHRAAAEGTNAWSFIWQCYVCPECTERATAEHGEGFVNIVKGGEYADGRPDPRADKWAREVREEDERLFWRQAFSE
jgi:hypothetical protein